MAPSNDPVVNLGVNPGVSPGVNPGVNPSVNPGVNPVVPRCNINAVFGSGFDPGYRRKQGQSLVRKSPSRIQQEDAQMKVLKLQGYTLQTIVCEGDARQAYSVVRSARASPLAPRRFVARSPARLGEIRKRLTFVASGVCSSLGFRV